MGAITKDLSKEEIEKRLEEKTASPENRRKLAGHDDDNDGWLTKLKKQAVSAVKVCPTDLFSPHTFS